VDAATAAGEHTDSACVASSTSPAYFKAHEVVGVVEPPSALLIGERRPLAPD